MCSGLLIIENDGSRFWVSRSASDRRMCAIWGLMMVIGLLSSANYQWGQGALASAPARWPHASKLKHPERRAAIVMFLHPFCPCSRASLAEFANLARQAPVSADLQIIFLTSSKFTEAVETCERWREASKIPNAELSIDADGKLARQFGANTSGTVLVYDRARRLLFDGGITPGRGHVGPNPGIAAVTAISRGEAQRHSDYPVFGCALFDTSICERAAR